MPTFKNETTHYIDHTAIIQSPTDEPQKILIRFKPNETRELSFWVPYQQLGLTLVNADYPAVPNTILVSGTFNFEEGTERRFNIEPCDTYRVNVIVQSGKIMMYTGSSPTAVEVSASSEVPYSYDATMDWEFAPYLRFVGREAGTSVTIHAEVEREGKAKKAGVRTWL